SRFLSAEDVIFLIRDDRGKVNRLRTYLSWKDVRKRAKEDEDRAGEVEEEIEDGAAGGEKAAVKGRKTMVKLPWEVLTPFSDFLKGLPGRPADDDDDEDDDEVQAYQDSMQRLRDADEITKRMTKDEYVHYSDCRQASFTYRKVRRFRDFVNFAAYLDLRPNDDIIDILGFLSFEMVRSLCVTALAVRDRLEQYPAPHPVLAPIHQLHSQRHKSVPAVTPGQSLFAPPPSAKQPLHPAHVLEAFAQIQRTQAANRVGGLRNFRGGLMTGRIALV
ncbi:hypothetical protein TREMEDRAFT_26842, partial [Tremella mesenterica DSM 1558]|uniref:uncharacterized protein n=1 Tax=Tremella mesenterica (strain ATCC 24925 / CBS 8224 / DSM 1558 / NBRC 9311 / NRRL Y-6157 / RJB 2259-6 / UBC 559-6) TaxID=578456 RepID=UPI0003F4A254